ncbi:hypothetical protein Taro_025446 [Colocasia esculenta]|uniref:Uncharacterized protein n=1 Tax=Colocasia esculenta TaxID=4460 RepID=A0A843VCA0_COLES|nr:hypothetical protein [Colocasia esculenta]
MLEVREQRPQDQRLPRTSARSSARSASPSGVVRDVAPLEETVETDSERGDYSGRRAKLASTWMDVHDESASTSMDANT